MRRAAITGLGAVCSLGLGVEAMWRGLCAGTQAVRRYAALQRAGLDVGPVGKACLPGEPEREADDGAAIVSATARATPLAVWAADEALRDAGFDPELGRRGALRLGVIVGTTNGEKNPWAGGVRALVATPDALPGGIPEVACAAPARALAARYGAARLRVVSMACASGNAAIGLALQWLREDGCDAVLCGGVDALQEFVVSGFVSLRAHAAAPCQPFDRARSGLNLGEGAGFLVVEDEARARARGQRIRAYLDGFGFACDAHHMTGPDRQGRGAAQAMTAALRDARLAPAQVDFVSAHGTATVFNDLMEANGLATVFGARSSEVPVNSIKGAIGHTLGAAGALEAVMAVCALEQELIPATAGHCERDPAIPLHVVAGAPLSAPLRTVLSTSSGFGGLNAALVLRHAATEPDAGGEP